LSDSATLVDNLRASARLHGGRVAVRDGGTAVSYASLWNQAVAVADDLRRRGLAPGERVCIVLANSSEFIAAYYGIQLAGGVVVLLNAAANQIERSKAFVNTFSESLRGELKRAGVHVTLLAPGPVRETLPVEHDQSLVEKLIPDFLWISTEYTAKLSLDALERNKMRVVPGVTSKAMSVASGYTPRAIVTPIVGAVYKKLGGG